MFYDKSLAKENYLGDFFIGSDSTWTKTATTETPPKPQQSQSMTDGIEPVSDDASSTKTAQIIVQQGAESFFSVRKAADFCLN